MLLIPRRQHNGMGAIDILINRVGLIVSPQRPNETVLQSEICYNLSHAIVVGLLRHVSDYLQELVLENQFLPYRGEQDIVRVRSSVDFKPETRGIRVLED